MGTAVSRLRVLKFDTACGREGVVGAFMDTPCGREGSKGAKGPESSEGGGIALWTMKI